jgi:DNA-binding transcriptional ArsR family regulator
MDAKFKKDPLFVIKDLDTLKLISDPLHVQMFELLCEKPLTVSQIARRLGTSGSRLYYHVNLMEAAGLIRVVETRLVNNIVEKIYWVTANEIEIDRDLLNFGSDAGQENVTRVMLASLDATREEMLRSLRAISLELEHGAPPHPRQMVIKKLKKRLRDETCQEFLEAFNRLLDTFDDLPEADEEDEDALDYSVACFLYPNFTLDDVADEAFVEKNHA